MKTVLEEINRQQFRPVYLFFGSERYLIDELVRALQMKLVGPDSSGFDFNLLDGERTTLSSLLTYVHTPPWYQQKRLVIVKNAPWFRGDRKSKGTEIKRAEETGEQPKLNAYENEASDLASFIQYLKNPLAETVLVLLAAGEVDRRRKLFRTLTSNGVAVECSELKEKQRRDWLKQKAHAMGLSLEGAALDYLIRFGGKSLYGLANELEKISLFREAGSNQISLALVQMLCTRQVEDRIFDIMDAVTEKKALLVLSRIRELLQSGVPPQRIFYLLVRHYRILLRARALMGQGYTNQELAKKLQIKQPWLVPKYLKQARGYSDTELIVGLKRMLEIDVALKTSEGSPDMWLEVLVAYLI
ncbi:MAG: DNA polymerase III subunit delta [Syntrophomonadaceae bacterium]|nr:DNA polymerase III subunit delta [Syntrophomonadaceae bacterium]